MSKTDFESFWTEEGHAHEHAPRWCKMRADMRRAFPSYYSAGAEDPLAEMVGHAIRHLDALKPGRPGPAYLGTKNADPDYDKAKRAELAPQVANVEDVIERSVDLFQGLVQWNHPLTMPNVIPPANLAAIIAAMMTEVFSPNIIEGEYSWNVEMAELESAAMLARLIGWDPEKAGGLYTFGGSGCYFYGTKYGLTRVLGQSSRHQGVRTDAKLLASQQGHYTKLNAADWSGLGMDNIIDIETDVRTNAMDVGHLEEVMADLHGKGIPVGVVVCTAGTTDTFAIDPVADARRLIEKYPNPEGYGAPFLYVDAVIGWSWLTFGAYDFDANPLGFSDDTLPAIRANYEAVKNLVHADAIGCDFHKVGWAPYNCSLFMFRDNEDFKNLMLRPGSDYLQERTTYNPGLYTLEVSRSGSYAMAGWATLRFFGHEGFQAVLGSILEVKEYLRGLLHAHPELVCVNDDDNGFSTLFRVYPEGVDASAQYDRELVDPAARQELIRHNMLQEKVADTMWGWYRDGELHEGEYAPYISYTTGFRPTEYNREESDPGAVIYGLKSFPMNVNVDSDSMKTLIKLVLAARDQVLQETTLEALEAEGEEELGEAAPEGPRKAVENLLSGITRRG
jgi:glutamate/tyrosine decarboxylase-like PLP-dependent enzyme